MTIKLILEFILEKGFKKTQKKENHSDFAYQMTNNLYLARGDSKKRNEKKAAEEFTTSTYLSYYTLASWQAWQAQSLPGLPS